MSITGKKAIVLSAIGIDKTVYKAGIIVVNDVDAEFGRNIKTIHRKAAVVIARIEGFKKTDDRKFGQIDVVHINTHGEELTKAVKRGEEEVEIPIVESFNIPLGSDVKVSFEEGDWTTDIRQAEAQVDRINDQFVSGLLPIIQMAQEHVDLVKVAKECSRGSKPSTSEEGPHSDSEELG